jgi:hypothetical protein
VERFTVFKELAGLARAQVLLRNHLEDRNWNFHNKQSTTAARVLEQNRHELMSQPGVLGVGVGASDINNQEAAIIVSVDQTSSRRPQLPGQIDGVRIRVIFTDPIIAF